MNIKHIAIIMDGNGRWAKKRFRPRIWGHVRGSGIVSDIVEEADNMGINALTLYAFSTENFGRPADEVKNLFKLLRKFILKERVRILKNNIKFQVIGDTKGLPEETKSIILKLENETKNATGLILNFAFGYGGRTEILNAVNKLVKIGQKITITEEIFSNELLTAGCPDVDLLIRTGGDQRISNFLLWQIAYAELFFTNTLWPDFTVNEFRNIISVIDKRERRFGQVVPSSYDEGKSKAKNNFDTLINGV